MLMADGQMIRAEVGGHLVDQPEKRKVGGSTPPLPTLLDQHQPRPRFAFSATWAVRVFDRW